MRFIARVALFLLSIFFLSCSSLSYVSKGDKILKSGRYFQASKMYDKAYTKEKNKKKKAEIAYKQANCFDKINEPQKAAIWYRKSILKGDSLPEIFKKLAYAELKNNNFEKAEEYFSNYLKLVKTEKDFENETLVLEQLHSLENAQGKYKVSILKEFSSYASDFSPIYMGSDTSVVFFTSNRKVEKKQKKDDVTGKYYSNIFESKYSNEIIRKYGKKRKQKTRKVITDTYGWRKATKLGDTINTTRNEGAACFSSDGKQFYFTSSRKLGKNNRGTKIFSAQKKGETWGQVSLLDLVPDTISVGHPSISEDGSVLYFVSDMLGGFGGNDIWMSKKEGSNWSKPQNLGEAVNSEADELFPFIRNDGRLYFSSDRAGGMGGLDIYEARQTSFGSWELNCMEAPINSNADDFSIHFRPNQESGMFASSRNKGNDDIYRFDYQELRFVLRGKVIHSNSKAPISQANISLVSSNGEQIDAKTDEQGNFEFSLKPDLEYIAMFSKEDFLNGKECVNTANLRQGESFIRTVALKPVEKPIELPNVFYEFGKWDLKEEAKTALNNLIETLNDNPKITVELRSHTDFLGSQSANRELSQKRAQEVVDYLTKNGIYWDRLLARGYGESQPRVVDKQIAEKYHFLQENQSLTEANILKMNKEQKEIANQLNRRTEFKVLSTNYVPGPNSKVKPNSLNQIGNTLIKDLSKVKGVFYTVQIAEVNENTPPPVVQNFSFVFRLKIGKTKNLYTTGIFDDLEEAKLEAEKIKKKGIKASLIACYKGKKISFSEAEKLKNERK